MKGPAGKALVHGLLDTGADETILPAFVLDMIGSKYRGGEVARFLGVGGEVVTVHYSDVELAIEHPEGRYHWTARVGFLDGRKVALLGYQGFLHYFTTTFNPERHWVSLKANKWFPGKFKVKK